MPLTKTASISLLLAIICILLTPLAHAVEERDLAIPVYKYNTTIDIKVPCVTASNFCNSGTNCTISIFDNHDLLVASGLMTKQATYYNYTAPSLDKGEYKASILCTNGTNAGFTYYSFYVTSHGLRPPTTAWNISFLIITIALIGLFIFLLFRNLQRFVELQFDLKDLSYNFIFYFSLFVIHWYNINYVGVEIADTFLTLFTYLGAITNILLPGILFVFCYMKWLWFDKTMPLFRRK